MPDIPRISIIIPVLNEAHNVDAVVRNAAAIGDETIVIDGGSNDGTLEALQSLDCVSRNGVRGRGQQLRAGAELATGDVLLFLHADARLTRDARQQVIAAWKASPDADNLFGGFRQRIDSDQFVFRLIETGNHWRAKRQKLIYGDQGMFVSRALYDRSGGVPPIPLMEDFEFSRQLSKFASPTILDGPLEVSTRRWQQNGPLRQTIRNWCIAFRYRMGAKPENLMQTYES